MDVIERAHKYKEIFENCKAIQPVREFFSEGISGNGMQYLEKLRILATKLSNAYEVSLPVITCWVRDDSYIPETEEIYLTEPDIRCFLHQFRHHLQNVERKYERRGLTTEGDLSIADIPYKDCVYLMRGEDDARAWTLMILDRT